MKTAICLATLIVAGILATSCTTTAIAPGERDGQVKMLADGTFVAWDAQRHKWLGPERFWIAFQERRRGRHWPDSSAFPPYEEVGEHDTVLLIREDGSCLMYFFHTRWRRANDVWRWGPEFNAYGGCPNVFRH